YALRGVPSIIWGTEAGLTGDKEPQNRAQMKFDEKHPMKAVISKAAELRRTHPSLQADVPVSLEMSGDALVVKRIAASEIATIKVAPAVSIAFEKGDFRARHEAAKRQWLTC